MNGSKFLQHVAVLGGAATFVGCPGNHKSVQVQLITVDPILGPVHFTKEGEILEWHLITGDKNKPFYIHFIGDGPCGMKVVPGKNGVASCTVVSPPDGVNYYEYYVDRSERPFASPPARPCSGCLIQNGPSPSSANKDSDKVNAVPTETPFVYCDQGKINIYGGNTPGSAIKWLGNSSVTNWSITFPTLQVPPCTNSGPYGVHNPTCNLPTPRAQSYKYTISADNCSSNDFTSPNTQ